MLSIYFQHLFPVPLPPPPPPFFSLSQPHRSFFPAQTSTPHSHTHLFFVSLSQVTLRTTCTSHGETSTHQCLLPHSKSLLAFSFNFFFFSPPLLLHGVFPGQIFTFFLFFSFLLPTFTFYFFVLFSLSKQLSSFSLSLYTFFFSKLSHFLLLLLSRFHFRYENSFTFK